MFRQIVDDGPQGVRGSLLSEREVAASQTLGGESRFKTTRFPGPQDARGLRLLLSAVDPQRVVALGTLDLVEAKDNDIFLDGPA